MSYTKGPWYIEMTTKVDGNDISHAICHGLNEYADGPAGQICLATSGRRADAELLAAAPDLYEALKEMRNFMAWRYGEDDQFVKTADRAMSKAEGRSND